MSRPGLLQHALLLLTLVVVHALPTSVGLAAPQAPAAGVCDIRTTERIVAVGDVHGAYDRFVGILRAAGVIDSRARWTGGRTVLVQTGDVLDRGADSRRVLDLLQRLEREAASAGGRVYALLGNHEVMRMIADWRYVSPEEIAAFRTSASEELRERVYGVVAAETAKRARDEKQAHDEAGFRERFMKNVPLGLIEMQQAFGPSGDYGKWLRDRNVLVQVNGIAFVHGGIDATTAALRCAGINEAVKRDLATAQPTPELISKMLATSETGPLWYRGLATEPDPAFAPQVADILRALGVRAIVVGHTVTNDLRITPRFAARVVTIDTGMLGGNWYPGGVASALEIRGDALTAIYENGREALPALAPVVP
jgi:calcineurin-like phosphoesterase family protein